MNYRQHYDNLIARAAGRKCEGYVEKHHIVPRCMGGSDAADNLVKLTAREHFLAHQLLCKIHPDVSGLVFAFRRLSTGNYGRPSSRVQGWLREKMATTAAENSRKRHCENPTILGTGAHTPEAREKARKSFAKTLEQESVRAKWSAAAKKRWETRDRHAQGERLKALRVTMVHPKSRPVVQLLPNGFIVNEYPNMITAAKATGHDKHTISDRVKRGHPFWVGVTV